LQVDIEHIPTRCVGLGIRDDGVGLTKRVRQLVLAFLELF
jgi:hypothetical protein